MLGDDAPASHALTIGPACACSAAQELMNISLNRLVASRNEPLSLVVSLRIAMDVAAGLAHLHQFGIIHLDVSGGYVIDAWHY